MEPLESAEAEVARAEVPPTGVPGAGVPHAEVAGAQVPHTGVPGGRVLGESRLLGTWGGRQRDPTTRGRRAQGQRHEYSSRGRMLQETGVGPPGDSSLTAPSPAPHISTAETPTSSAYAPTGAGSEASPGGPPSGVPELAQEPGAPGPAAASGGAWPPRSVEAIPTDPQWGVRPSFPAPALPAPFPLPRDSTASDSETSESSPSDASASHPNASSTEATDSPASNSTATDSKTSDLPSSDSRAPQPASAGAQSRDAAGSPAPAAAPGEWRPQPGKFLLAICLYGRMSNQVGGLPLPPSHGAHDWSGKPPTIGPVPCCNGRMSNPVSGLPLHSQFSISERKRRASAVPLRLHYHAGQCSPPPAHCRAVVH